MPGIDEEKAEKLLKSEEPDYNYMRDAYVYGNESQKQRALDKLRRFIETEVYPNDPNKARIAYESNKRAFEMATASVGVKTDGGNTR